MHGPIVEELDQGVGVTVEVLHHPMPRQLHSTPHQM